MKKYRFFYHYNKHQSKMTVHFRGKCYIAKHIICEPESQTHYRPSQPHLVMRGWCRDILPNESIDTLVILN